MNILLGDNYIYMVLCFVYIRSQLLFETIIVFLSFFGLISMNFIDFNLVVCPISIIIFEDVMVAILQIYKFKRNAYEWFS